ACEPVSVGKAIRWLQGLCRKQNPRRSSKNTGDTGLNLSKLYLITEKLLKISYNYKEGGHG
ncbi:MAG: hypothetical protein LUG16_01620, partial [Candidatus Gastranaerophilales bacterium]|nr:hypothetical protein [Candidatus Gastranaerophilales bacterium]